MGWDWSRLLKAYLWGLLVLRMVAVPFSLEEIALAQIIQGEANHEFMRDNGMSAYCVGWVVRNRLEAGKCQSYLHCQRDFNGTIITDPQWWYLFIARLVINGEEDPTAGALHVLSQQDVDELGFDVEEASLVIRASAYRSLYFFERWQRGDVVGDHHTGH